MKSLFDINVNEEMIGRIDKLTSDMKAQWGKMTVSQMLSHAQKPFKVAYSELMLKRGLIGIFFGGIAKKKLTGPEPFGKNLPTDPGFKITGQPDFNEEKERLKDYVRLFATRGPSGITKDPHPFFGRMTAVEWDALMYKHLDHHLRQFGV